MIIKPNLILLIAISLLITLIISQDLVALEPPELNGRINDYGDMISPDTEQVIDQSLQDLERKDFANIIVLDHCFLGWRQPGRFCFPHCQCLGNL